VGEDLGGGHSGIIPGMAAPDSLDVFLQRFELRARVFYAGNLCGLVNFDAAAGVGHLHLLKAGEVEVIGPDGLGTRYAAPSLLMFPRVSPYRMRMDDPAGAELICASVEFGAQFGNPLVQALPAVVSLPLKAAGALDAVLQALFAEAFAQHSGRAGLLDRLCEVVMIYLLRHVADSGALRGGVAAGLADPRLAQALGAIHESPAQAWTLDALAERCGMSRARFAAHFAAVVGQPPAEYLASWRVSLAQKLLAQGRPLKSIADEVGYGSPSALTRAFSRQLGLTPSEWLARRSSTAP
jgi:AraC-like DNA-binding protein